MSDTTARELADENFFSNFPTEFTKGFTRNISKETCELSALHLVHYFNFNLAISNMLLYKFEKPAHAELYEQLMGEKLGNFLFCIFFKILF